MAMVFDGVKKGGASYMACGFWLAGAARGFPDRSYAGKNALDRPGRKGMDGDDLQQFYGNSTLSMT
jgi:hypothetical protein